MYKQESHTNCALHHMHFAVCSWVGCARCRRRVCGSMPREAAHHSGGGCFCISTHIFERADGALERLSYWAKCPRRRNV